MREHTCLSSHQWDALHFLLYMCCGQPSKLPAACSAHETGPQGDQHLGGEAGAAQQRTRKLEKK